MTNSHAQILFGMSEEQLARLASSFKRDSKPDCRTKVPASDPKPRQDVSSKLDEAETPKSSEGE
jgi:hypothetical protein